MRIKAALLENENAEFKFTELELDEPRANEVLVKIVASGICHTDAAAKEGMMNVKMPAVLGHEGVGIVEKIGSEVTGFEKGDHVVIGFSSCGHCEFCLSGNAGACENFNELNMYGAMRDGSHRDRKSVV